MKTIEEIVKTQLSKTPELSFNRIDIEKRLALPAGRFTSAGPVLPILLAVILTVSFYLLLSVFPWTRITEMFTARGVIPYTIVLFTAWSLTIVVVKRFKVAVQEKALRLQLLPLDDPGFVITPASSQIILERLHQLVDDPKNFLLTRRIHLALANLRNIGNIADVDKILETQSDSDEAVVDSSYTVLRGFIWAIPVLGFIGTVLGLSVALGSFGGVLSNAQQMEELRTALHQVTGGLSTAFETTLEGLVGALCVHMAMTALQRREERFLDDCREYCQKYIVGRLRLSLKQN